MNWPIPGSIIICESLMPCFLAYVMRFFRKSLIVLMTSLYLSFLVVVLGVLSLLYIRITGHLCFAMIFAIFGSPLSAVTSFTMFAPACKACSATSDLYVSIEIGIFVNFRSSFIIGITLFNSSSNETSFEPGPVDSPPTSIMSAPCFSSSRALFSAFLRVLNSPPSLKESGVTFKIPIICSFLCFIAFGF